MKTQEASRLGIFYISNWFLFIYIILLFYITLFAWNYGASLGAVGPGGRNYNLTPFFSIYRIYTYSPDMMVPLRILGGNVLLFIPFGLLFPLFLESIRKRKKTVSFFLVVITGMLLSTFIEINQFLFTYRVANVDDIILNTLGTFIGAVMYKVTKWVRIV
ncbi:VanZ family protein [Bacillus shivajii]|nr:VanZ family protein [Bacillus shivajii]